MSDAIQVDLTAQALARDVAHERTLTAFPILVGLVLAKILIQFAGIAHYGFFRDELYYMACGEHPAWGYVDQPPFIAWVAWFANHVLGNSMIAVRILPVLAGAAVIFLTGVLAAELGGGKTAQSVGALAMLVAPAYLAFDSFFSMNAFEPLFWLLCAWIAVRIVRGASQKMWLAFGLVAGIGLENKHTMLVFGFALVAGLLLAGEWRLFRSKWIWVGGAIAFAIFLPNLIWEATHGWPQIEVVRNAQDFKNVPVGPLEFLLEQILFLHPLSVPLWVGGLAWFFVASEGKRYRFLGWAYVIVLLIFMVLRGKTYYVLPVYPILLAAGGVAFEKVVSAGNFSAIVQYAYPVILVLAGIVTVPFGVPVLPVNTFLHYAAMLPYDDIHTEKDATVALPQLYADMTGWDNMAATVARVYYSLPESQRADCAILGGNYGEAGAIDYYGPKLGLPKAISGHNAYFYWGPRNYSGVCVILFGENAERTKRLFGEVREAARILNPYGMPGEINLPVYICRKPEAPLATLWPQFKMII